MSNQKKPSGRGRGSEVSGEGPWKRNRTKEESKGIRRPKDDQKREFSLTNTEFPPLPGSSTLGTVDNDDNKNGAQLPVDHVDNDDNKNGAQLPVDHVDNDDNKNGAQLPGDRVDNDDKKNDAQKIEPYTKGELENFGINTKDSDSNKNEPYPPVVCEEEPGTSAPEVTQTIVKSNLSPYAQEFLPRCMNIENLEPVIDADYENHMAGLTANCEETLFFCYERIREVPAIFETMMHIATPHFEMFLKHTNLVEKIVQDLYSYVLQDQAFAYHALNIFVYLSKFDISIQTNELRNRLLKLAQSESRRITTELDEAIVQTESTIAPFLHFLSELYVQMIVGNDRLVFLGVAVINILKKLLTVDVLPIKEKLTLVMNIVKLTGISLDADNPEILTTLLGKVQYVLMIESNNLDDHTKQMIDNVIKLRDSKWDLESGEQPRDEQLREGQPGILDQLAVAIPNECEGVFYGPDGQVLGPDEHRFLQRETVDDLHSDDQLSEPSPGSMDGEMQEAYEEFLRTLPTTNNCKRTSYES